MIRDKLVVGILDEKLSKQMQKMDVDELTEHKAATMVRQAESVNKQCNELKNLNHGASVSTVSHSGQTKCKMCLLKHKVGDCPAKDRKCRVCDKKGHYAKACYAKKNRSWHSKKSADFVDADDEKDAVYLGELRDSKSAPWTKEITLNGRKVLFKLDSGADVSVVPNSVIKGQLTKCTQKLYGPGRHRLTVKGQIDALLELSGREIKETLFVVPEQKCCLLSRSACIKLGLITLNTEVNKVEVSSEVNKFKTEFMKIFSGLGKIDMEANIELQPDSHPYAVQTPRSVPYPLQNKVKQELDRMVKNGVIFPVTQPTDWCAPMVVVPKPNNNVRICVMFGYVSIIPS
ncbi:Uncharacterised protein at_DN1532 [Pycnogonum litorale]